MQEFNIPVQHRWSDLDPNFHVRHSVYYDWGAMCRVDILNKYGLTSQVMAQLKFGPILFREECVFRREVRSGDDLRITLNILKARQDYSRWSIRHEIIKKEDDKDVLCAILNVDGAWIDMAKRKLATPPEQVKLAFEQMPRSADFEWLS